MKKFYTILLLFFVCQSYASSIILHTKNATIWLPHQVIHCEIFELNVQHVTVHVNDSIFILAVNNQHRFTISILLKQPITTIWAEAGDKRQHITSDTIQYELGYIPLPQIHPFATSNGNKILLHAAVKSNPYNALLSFNWKADKRNPAPARITNNSNGAASLQLPGKKGDYYFDLEVIAGKDTAHFKTIITRSNSIHCFNLEQDHSAWIDSAVMYEITPHIFVKNTQYDDISAKLPELKQLGINVIWLQPIFKTHAGGQGYDITDYFSLRKEFGNEQQLLRLILKAKSLNMKVIFDIVPNHTSIFHPYAEDVILHGTDSYYYNFYQHEDDGAMYSSLYKQDSSGFYHYFWPKLVNLNYQSSEVQQWMIEACKYWIRKFDIDGYRFDAIWAMNARNILFGKKLQLELKSIKPDILLLAEDKGANKEVYEQGYDAAYDWMKDTSWISHWSWQYNYDAEHNPTIFNYPDEDKRGSMLRNSLFNNGDARHLRLRFMENNDVPRFLTDHGLDRTKMIAALVFALPGIPLIYNGQEIGCSNKVYSSKPIFKADESIQSQDEYNLFNYYKLLAQARLQHTGLYSLNIKNLPVSADGSVVALHRWKKNEHFVIIINMSQHAHQANVDVSSVNETKTAVHFTDVLTGDSFPSSTGNLMVNMQSYSTRWLLMKNGN